MYTRKIVIAVVVATISVFIYYAFSPLLRTIVVDDEDLSEKTATEILDETSQGPFPIHATTGHPAEGYVRIIKSIEETILRFESYKTINGPDLHIYLAKDLDAKEYIDLGPIRGTEGNINYAIPGNITVSEYAYVLVWCEPFSVLFNYAELKG
ncbi:MAG TPA: DM13 domain-containing protein [Candidatus Paceibacterota bacterium]